jgi:hypothetical protein
MNNMAEYDFSIRSTISKSLVIYRENWQLLLKLSALSAFISLLYQGFSTAGRFVASQPHFISGLILFIEIPIVIAVVYYSIRVGIAMQIGVLRYLRNESSTLASTYKEAGNFVGRVFIASLLMFAILIIPLILFAIGQVERTPMHLKLVFSGMGLISSVYLVTKYAFAVVLRVIRPSEKAYLKYSSRLVNGNFLKVLIIWSFYWIISIIFYIVQQTTVIDQLTGWGSVVFENLPLIIGIFYSPFQTALLIMSIYNLEISNDMNTSIVETRTEPNTL